MRGLVATATASPCGMAGRTKGSGARRRLKGSVEDLRQRPLRILVLEHGLRPGKNRAQNPVFRAEGCQLSGEQLEVGRDESPDVVFEQGIVEGDQQSLDHGEWCGPSSGLNASGQRPQPISGSA